MECRTDWNVTNPLSIALYINSKEGRGREILVFIEKCRSLNQGLFDEEMFVTVKKKRVLTGNIRYCQEGKVSNVKRPKLSRNKGS